MSHLFSRLAYFFSFAFFHSNSGISCLYFSKETSAMCQKSIGTQMLTLVGIFIYCAFKSHFYLIFFSKFVVVKKTKNKILET